MRALIQRVLNAGVSINGEVVGKAGHGFLVLLGVTHTDTEKDAEFLAEKVANLRIFEDENEKMNLSLLDVDGEQLVISQFTLYGECRKGRRPGFSEAARPEIANPLYERFVSLLKEQGVKHVDTGRFGADMQVSLINDGPVTLLLESPAK